MARKVFLTAFLALTILFAQPTQQTAQQDAFLELVFRYLQGSGTSRQFAPEFFVGRLPDDLTVNVPLPPRARLLGSVRRDKMLYIVADANEPALQVREFYRSALTATGWQERRLEEGQRRGGLVMPSLSQAETYCLGPRGPGLSVFATQTDGQATDLRLTLTLDARSSPCSYRGGSPQFDRTPLPTLATPEGVRWLGGGGSGGSSDHRYTQALVETEITTSDLAGRFAPQLEAEGWAKISENLNPRVTISSWTRRDEFGSEWQSVLVLTKIGNTKRMAVALSTYLVE